MRINLFVEADYLLSWSRAPPGKMKRKGQIRKDRKLVQGCDAERKETETIISVQRDCFFQAGFCVGRGGSIKQNKRKHQTKKKVLTHLKNTKATKATKGQRWKPHETTMRASKKSSEAAGSTTKRYSRLGLNQELIYTNIHPRDMHQNDKGTDHRS